MVGMTSRTLATLANTEKPEFIGFRAGTSNISKIFTDYMTM